MRASPTTAVAARLRRAPGRVDRLPVAALVSPYRLESGGLWLLSRLRHQRDDRGEVCPSAAGRGCQRRPRGGLLRGRAAARADRPGGIAAVPPDAHGGA